MKLINLNDILSGDVTGFAVERGGMLLADTVASTASDAAIAALCDAGFEVIGGCQTPGCKCMESALKQFIPDAVLVEVCIRRAK